MYILISYEGLLLKTYALVPRLHTLILMLSYKYCTIHHWLPHAAVCSLSSQCAFTHYNWQCKIILHNTQWLVIWYRVLLKGQHCSTTAKQILWLNDVDPGQVLWALLYTSCARAVRTVCIRQRKLTSIALTRTDNEEWLSLWRNTEWQCRKD